VTRQPYTWLFLCLLLDQPPSYSVAEHMHFPLWYLYFHPVYYISIEKQLLYYIYILLYIVEKDNLNKIFILFWDLLPSIISSS